MWSGRDAGKGEEFSTGVCVPPLETTLNTNCAIPWDSDEKFGPPCMDFGDLDTLGDPTACQHTWMEWYHTIHNYSVTLAGTQLDIG